MEYTGRFMAEPTDAYGSMPDEELARLVQNGDEQAFGVLVERYGQKLLRYGRKFLADPDNIEDIVQDVFLRVYQNIKSFDATRRFSPWIYRIAHNAFVNALKKSSRGSVPVFDFDALVAHQAYEDPVPAEKEREEIGVLLKRGLNTLTPAYREILILNYIEGLSYQAIADVLHIPMGTVGVRLSRARAALKEYISREQHV
jgi:RNA polymerase sigma-70 factor (ECF subfamily)